MSVNTQTQEPIESPIITGTYGWTPIEISQILDGGRDFLNRKLVGKTLEQQVRILEKSGYIFEQRSWFQDIQHYVKKEEGVWELYAISTVLRNELVSFWGDYFAEEISVAIQTNTHKLKWFYVKRNGKWHLYEVQDDYQNTGKTFLSDISQKNPEGFGSIEEFNNFQQNQRLEKELAWKWYQEQLGILQNSGFILSSQQSSITTLIFLSRKKQMGEENILVDQKNQQLFLFDGIYTVEDLSIYVGRNHKPLGITIKRNGRWYYFPLPEQYTSQLVCQRNPLSSDWGFESQNEVTNFLRLLYTPTSWNIH